MEGSEDIGKSRAESKDLRSERATIVLDKNINFKENNNKRKLTQNILSQNNINIHSLVCCFNRMHNYT